MNPEHGRELLEWLKMLLGSARLEKAYYEDAAIARKSNIEMLDRFIAFVEASLAHIPDAGEKVTENNP